ncbi:ROK family protein [Paenibacillus sp. NPDC057934]|uniref:ROK family protein n=1 Tax=Paenibacillus sp. NPDC057934 TaxID=3346282 RepID=UPI0036D87205
MKNEYVWGLDIGGTHLRIGLFNRGTLISVQKRAWEGNDFEQDTKTFLNLIHECISEWGVPCACGISFAGILTPDQLEVISWPNRPWWKGIPVNVFFSSLPSPFAIEDDAASALLGELNYGAGKGKTHLFMATVGTGIGGGMVLEGKLYRGRYGWAADLGHMQVSNNYMICSCGKRGCLQALASGPAILRQARMLSPYKDISENQLSNAIYNRETWSNQAVSQAASYLGRALANVVKLIDPEMVIVGGGIVQKLKLYFDECESAFRNELGENSELVIVKAALGDDAGLYGAYSLISKSNKE